MGCSVNGVILFDKPRSRDALLQVEQRLKQVVQAATDRGRDSYGFCTLDTDGRFRMLKRVGRFDGEISGPLVTSATRIVINNCRAEPTTEYVAEKTEGDIQPFHHSGIIVSHNGTIANDRELKEKCALTYGTRVDSAVIPPLLAVLWRERTAQALHESLRTLVGSYALAVASADDPTRLFLAVNYKPLYIQYNRKHEAIYFTSLEDYFGAETFLDADVKSLQLPPYSTTEIDIRGNITTYHDPKPPKRRALCVCSAGLDSTIAAAYAEKVWGMDITLCHFLYKCRAEEREKERIPLIAEALNCDYVYIPIDVFKNVIKHSRLTETHESIVTEREGEAGAELAYEWVPARNLIMLAVATGYAEAHGYDTIILGNNLEEAGAYPDNEMIFVKKLNEALPYAVNLNKHVRIEMPVGNLMKHEIIKLGVQIGAPLELTWSCYESSGAHCGKCGPCYMRRKAFEINGLKDPVPTPETQ